MTRQRETWAARKARILQEALDALWAGLPMSSRYIFDQMDHLTPHGGKDGPEWADWFRSGGVPRSVEELIGALCVLIRAYNSYINHLRDMFQREFSGKNVEMDQIRRQLAEAQAEVAALRATLRSPFTRLFAQARVALDTFRQLWGDYKAKHGKFQVRLERCGPSKIQVIKALRELKQLGLKEAKDLADSAPCVVLEYGEDEEVQRYLRLLKEAGAETSTKLL